MQNLEKKLKPKWLALKGIIYFPFTIFIGQVVFLLMTKNTVETSKIIISFLFEIFE